MVVAGTLFFLQYSLTGKDNWISLFIGVLFIVMVRLFRFDRVVFRFSFKLFIYLICSLTIFSFYHSMAVRLFHLERQARDQFRFGKDFLTERDVLGEYLLDQARQRIENDQFIQTRMASPFLSKAVVINKIRRVYLNNYFDRYEVNIVTRLEGDTLAHKKALC